MKKKLKFIILSVGLVLASFTAYPQGKGPEPPAPPPPPGRVPIDGGLSILLAAGIAYGVYETKRKK